MSGDSRHFLKVFSMNRRHFLFALMTSPAWRLAANGACLFPGSEDAMVRPMSKRPCSALAHSTKRGSSASSAEKAAAEASLDEVAEADLDGFDPSAEEEDGDETTDDADRPRVGRLSR